MSNNMLGLKIVRINQGYTDLLEINGNQSWTKNVWDIRKDLENIDNLDGSSAVLMLTSIDTGHILTVASLIEGRTTDCISAWIYIPATISISGKELVKLVDSAKKEILANERDDERLNQLFSKSYESAPAAKMIEKSFGDKCAYRYYGQGAKYTLSELLKDMCQSYYKNYKSIFFLDNATNLRCLSGDDLTDQKVYSMIVVKAPGRVDGFIPYIGEQPFTGQMYAIEGDIIKIEWRKNGYLPIQTETTIKIDLKYSVPTPNQYKRLISFDIIKVVDESNHSIDEYDLYIDGKLVERGSEIALSEAVINNKVEVKIQAEGYEYIRKYVNLTQRVEIKLTKETYTYEFMLPLKNQGIYYSIKISCNREIKSSPVQGYVLEEGHIGQGSKNQLRFKPFSRKFWITCLICSVIVLLLGFCGGYAVSDFIGGKTDNKEVSKLTQENADLKSKIKELEKRNYNYAPKDTMGNTIDAAIDYLDNNNTWNRTKMEKYSSLKGLWDALNERRFEDILEFEKTLFKSTRFAKVVDAVNQNKTKKIESKNNSDPNDYDIVIEKEGSNKGYIKRLYDAKSKTATAKEELPKAQSKNNAGDEPQKEKSNKYNHLIDQEQQYHE